MLALSTFANVGKHTKQVAWYLDDCGAQGYVEKYVNELKKYINVDIYGPCGDFDCTPEANQVEVETRNDI